MGLAGRDPPSDTVRVAELLMESQLGVDEAAPVGAPLDTVPVAELLTKSQEESGGVILVGSLSGRASAADVGDGQGFV